MPKLPRVTAINLLSNKGLGLANFIYCMSIVSLIYSYNSAAATLLGVSAVSTLMIYFIAIYKQESTAFINRVYNDRTNTLRGKDAIAWACKDIIQVGFIYLLFIAALIYIL